MTPPTKEQLKQWDEEDELKWTRGEFEIPDAKACGGDVEGEAIYFCGNSLGLLSRRSRKYMMEELDTWSKTAVNGHFNHKYDRPWMYMDRPLLPVLADILGCKTSEIAHNGTLTNNMHNLFTTYYAPTPQRWRIVIEKGAFPSDWYAAHCHPKLHAGVLSQDQIDNAVIALSPRQGEDILRTEDILKVLDQYKDEIAIVWLPVVQYYTGQLLDVVPLVKKTHEIGALFGLDLAHGTGNVELKLDEWGVDLAVWCTYKYLNGGPGAVGGFFIRSGLEDTPRRLCGWWGNAATTRFEMRPKFEPAPGAAGHQHSNINVFGSIPLLGTLEIIDKATFPALKRKADRLNAALDALLRSSPYFLTQPSETVGFRIITPPQPWRGSQISIFIHGKQGVMTRVFERMVKNGLIGDERQPDVIRLAPVTLYNTFEEVGRCVDILNKALSEEK